MPEQNSFEAEVALCRAGGDTISRFAEVLSFTRLAARVFSTEGGAAVPVLDQSGRLIAMAGALELLRPRLKLYADSVAKPEFLKQLLQIVDEFHGCGLNCQSADRAIRELEGPLAEKLSELLQIVEIYDAVCSEAKQDPSTRLDRLRDALIEGSFAEHAHIVVEGFSDFTEQELDVLTALTEKAEQVTVYLTCDGLNSGQAVFDTTRHTANELCRKAKGRGVPVSLFRIAPPKRKSPLQVISESLFAPVMTPWQEAAEEILLAPCRSAAEECAAAVGRIQRLVRDGCRYRDIAVAYTDPTVYGSAVETVLRRASIPFYASGSKEILRHGVIRGVLSALEAACCGMDAESVCEYLKSGYAPVSQDQADRLENYAFVWNIHGGKWNQPFTKDPAGPSVDRRADSAELLAQLNEARVLAVAALCDLQSELKDARNTASQVEALDRFLRCIGLEEQLAEKADEMERCGEYQSAQELTQLYEIVLNVMEQMYGVLGDTVRTPEEFFRLFRAALTQNTVGSIPATVDCVKVGEIRAMRHTSVRHLLLIGANDALFPSFDRPDSLLSDSERKLLKRAGLSVAPDDVERMDRTLLIDYCVLTAPTETLFVSCDRENPSYLFLRLQRLFERNAAMVPALLPARPDQMAALLASSPSQVREEVLLKHPELRAETEKICVKASYTPGKLDPDAVRQLYGRVFSLSSSKIDKLAACRYSYFLQFGIGLQEMKQADLDPTVYGILVHDVLEHTVRAVQEEGGFRSVSLERTLELCRLYFDRFLNEKLNDLESYSPRGAYLVRRNYREIEQVVRTLYRELSNSEFIPVSFEQVFANDTAIEIHAERSEARLSGVVDRVDLYSTSSGKTYLRVIDYKTGRKDFDYTDILNGMGMQMLIYLFALTGEAERFYGRQLTPAGVLYVPARYDVQSTKGRLNEEEAEKERRKQVCRKGLILDDGDVLSAMEPGADPIFLPYKSEKKTGERTGSLASAEQLQQIESHVARTLRKLTDSVGSGEIDPNPYWRGADNNACNYCPYRQICRVDSGEVPLRRLRVTKADRFWQSIEKEAEQYGD